MSKQPNSRWRNKPKSGVWTNEENWADGEVPKGKAIFSESAVTQITFDKSQSAEVDSIEFDEEADSFLILFGASKLDEKLLLTIRGEGVSNRSGKPQLFKVAATNSWFRDPQLKFAGEASAGGDTLYYESGPVDLETGYGGGIIGFTEKSNAGTANFVVRTGKQHPPDPHVQRSTVGGEVSFSDHSRAHRAKFTIYGSLGDDGDTFGNTVFHDYASADHATFINIGGTVEGGDGGNTQFYDHSSSDHAVFLNFGASHAKGNGGDVAFDSNASGGYGVFHNHAATAAEGNGGVTSFNNNPPKMPSTGASAGHGMYHNYGAREEGHGGGGHTEFTAKYASPTAYKAAIMNYGSVLSATSTAGHTIFSVNFPNEFFPTAGESTIWNYPATGKNGAPGYTEFSIWGEGAFAEKVPTAGKATIHNLGGTFQKAAGGCTSFSKATRAENATLIAYCGCHGGCGGEITFSDTSRGEKACVSLFGNGVLDMRKRSADLQLAELVLNEGIIRIDLKEESHQLIVTKKIMMCGVSRFEFHWAQHSGIKKGFAYPLLTAKGLADIPVEQFQGNEVAGMEPKFSIKKDSLFVSFG